MARPIYIGGESGAGRTPQHGKHDDQNFVQPGRDGGIEGNFTR